MSRPALLGAALAAAWLLAVLAGIPGEDLPRASARAAANSPRSELPSGSAARSSRPIPKPSPTLNRQNDARRQSASSGSAAGSFWRTLGALLLVLTLVLGAAFLVRKHAPASLVGLPLEAIELLGKRNLDQRQSVILVRCGSRVMILGSSAAGLTMLSEVSDPVEVDYLVGLCRPKEPDSPVARSFRQLLVRSGLATPETKPTPRSETPEHSQILSGDFSAQTATTQPLKSAHG